MEKITINFLGTGNAIPTEKRNHTGILLSFMNENILVDCGEGIQRQFRKAHLSPTKITRILITHWHGDHILGIPGLLQTLAMSGYQRTLKIYGPPGTRHYITLIRELLMNIRINLEIHEIHQGKFIDEKNFAVEAKPMIHGISCLAYALIIKDKIRLNKAKLKKLKIPNSPILKELQAGRDILINGKKIKAKSVSYIEKGKKIVCILDTRFTEQAIELAQKADILITEATFSSKEAEKAREYNHLTAKDAALIAKKAKVGQLIITHISQRYEHALFLIEREAKKTFKKSRVARDFEKKVI